MAVIGVDVEIILSWSFTDFPGVLWIITESMFELLSLVKFELSNRMDQTDALIEPQENEVYNKSDVIELKIWQDYWSVNKLEINAKVGYIMSYQFYF